MTKHFSMKGVFSEKWGRHSVNEGFGKDFYRKGNCSDKHRAREPRNLTP